MEIQKSLIKVEVKLGIFQALCGSRSLFFVTLNALNEITCFKASLPKNDGVAQFVSADEKLSFKAAYQGGVKGGTLLISPSQISDFDRFFFKFFQPAGHIEETRTFFLSEEPKERHKQSTVALIPCYNVAEHCRKVIETSLSYADKLILVNDGSVDDTHAVLQDLKSKYPEKIDLIHFEKNRGKGHCLLEGFKHIAKNKDKSVIVTLDSDTQHKPSEIPIVAQPIYDGFDMCMGCRFFQSMPLRSRLGNEIIAWMLKRRYIAAPKDTQSGYRSFSIESVQKIANGIHGGRYETEMESLLYALSKGFRLRCVPVTTIYINGNDSSSFSAIKDSLKILKVLFRHDRSNPKTPTVHRAQ